MYIIKGVVDFPRGYTTEKAWIICDVKDALMLGLDRCKDKRQLNAVPSQYIIQVSHTRLGKGLISMGNIFHGLNKKMIIATRTDGPDINIEYNFDCQISADKNPLVKEDPLFLNISEKLLESNAAATPILLPDSNLDPNYPAPILFLPLLLGTYSSAGSLDSGFPFIESGEE